MALFVRAQSRMFFAAAAWLSLGMCFFADAAVAQEVRPALPEGWQQLDAAGFVAAARQLFAAPLPPDTAHHREVVAHAWSQFLGDADFVATADRELLVQAIELFVSRRSRLVTGATDEERAASQAQVEAALTTLNQRVRARMLANADYTDARTLIATLGANGWSGAEQAQFAADWMQAHDWRALPLVGRSALVEHLSYAELRWSQISARWTGFLTAPVTGEYTLVQLPFHDGDSAAKVWINNELVLNSWPPADQSADEERWSGQPKTRKEATLRAAADRAAAAARFRSSPLALTADQPAAVRIELWAGQGRGRVNQDAGGLALAWERGTANQELIPPSAWTPPPDFAAAGAMGLKAEYFSDTSFTAAALLATRLEPLDRLWHTAPVAVHDAELRAVVYSLQVDLTNDDYLANLTAAESRALHQAGVWRHVARHLSLGERAPLLHAMLAHQAVLEGLDARQLGEFLETTYALPGGQPVALVIAWLEGQPPVESRLGRLRDREADSYWVRNNLPFESIGRWFTGPYFDELVKLWDERLARPSGECELALAYLSVHAAVEEGRLTELQERMNAALANEQLSGDARASWLTARAYLRAAALGGVPFPAKGLADREEALLVAESPAARYRALAELVAAWASMGEAERVRQLIQDFGQNVTGETERAALTAWQQEADALAAYYAEGEVRQRTAQRASRRQTLERRLDQAQARGDEAEVGQLRQLLSHLPE